MKIAVILLGVFGLFTQLFNGNPFDGITVASIAAISLGVARFYSASFFGLSLLLSIAVLGCIYDTAQYYLSAHVAGNDYGAWLWSMPTIFCMFWIVVNVRARNL